MLIVLMTQPLLQQTNNLLVVMQTMLLVLSFWFALNINSRLIDGVTVLDADTSETATFCSLNCAKPRHRAVYTAWVGYQKAQYNGNNSM